MAVTRGKLIVGASITTKSSAGADAVYTVNKGDAITNLKIAATVTDGAETTIASCVFLGVTVRGTEVKRGAVECYDGVPCYQPDPDGEGAFYGTIDEVCEVRSLVVEVTTGQGNDAKTETRVIPIDSVLSIGGVTPANNDG